MKEVQNNNGGGWKTIPLCGWKCEEWGELWCRDVDPVIVIKRGSGNMEESPAGVKNCLLGTTAVSTTFPK